MDNKALIDAMKELADRMTDRDHHAHELARLDEEIPALWGRVIALRGGRRVAPKRAAGGRASAANLTPEARSERARKGGLARWAGAIGRPKQSEPPAPTDARGEMLAKLRAAPEDGLPAGEFVPRGKRGAAAPLGQLARAHKARKLPNGNWVAA